MARGEILSQPAPLERDLSAIIPVELEAEWSDYQKRTSSLKKVTEAMLNDTSGSIPMILYDNFSAIIASRDSIFDQREKEKKKSLGKSTKKLLMAREALVDGLVMRRNTPEDIEDNETVKHLERQIEHNNLLENMVPPLSSKWKSGDKSTADKQASEDAELEARRLEVGQMEALREVVDAMSSRGSLEDPLSIIEDLALTLSQTGHQYLGIRNIILRNAKKTVQEDLKAQELTEQGNPLIHYLDEQIVIRSKKLQEFAEGDAGDEEKKPRRKKRVSFFERLERIDRLGDRVLPYMTERNNGVTTRYYNATKPNILSKLKKGREYDAPLIIETASGQTAVVYKSGGNNELIIEAPQGRLENVTSATNVTIKGVDIKTATTERGGRLTVENGDVHTANVKGVLLAQRGNIGKASISSGGTLVLSEGDLGTVTAMSGGNVTVGDGDIYKAHMEPNSRLHVERGDIANLVSAIRRESYGGPPHVYQGSIIVAEGNISILTIIDGDQKTTRDLQAEENQAVLVGLDLKDKRISTDVGSVQIINTQELLIGK